MITFYFLYTESEAGDSCFAASEGDFQAALLGADNVRSYLYDFTMQATGRDDSRRRIMILIASDQQIGEATRMRALVRVTSIMARTRRAES